MLPAGEAVALLARGAGDERAAADPAATRRLAELCGRLPLARGSPRTAPRPIPTSAWPTWLRSWAPNATAWTSWPPMSRPPRVRAVFSWSYRALAPASARSFRLLGLHPGQDISTAAAAALLDAPVPETRQLLRTLTGGHLLIEETGRDRYQFHDLVCVYAAECAQVGEPDAQQAAAIRRLLTWYLHTADAFRRILNPDNRHVLLDPPPPSCRPSAFTTHRQAWHWAESELANLVPVLHKASTAGDDVPGLEAPGHGHGHLDLFGHMADIIPGLRSALTASRKLGDRTAEAWILASLAEAYPSVGQPDAAIECCQGALAISAGTSDWYSQWEAWHLEGTACLDLGRLGEAVDRLQQSLATARQASDIRTAGMSLTWLGAVHERLGAFEIAISLREQAVAALKQARNRWQYAFALQQLAEACHHHGRIGDAIGNYRQARAIFRQIGDRRTEADILLQLGHAQETAGQSDAARQSWQQALVIFEEFRDPRADQVRTQLRAEASKKASGTGSTATRSSITPDS